MNAPAPVPATRLLRLEVRRQVQSGMMRRSSLHREGTLLATLRLENAVFRPGQGMEITGTGALRLAFPNARTLQIVSQPQARRILHGTPVSLFAAATVCLRNLQVQLDEQTVALLGEMNHTRFPGEMTLTIRGYPGVAHLPADTPSRPFALPLSVSVPAPFVDPPAANAVDRPSPRASVPTRRPASVHLSRH